MQLLHDPIKYELAETLGLVISATFPEYRLKNASGVPENQEDSSHKLRDQIYNQFTAPPQISLGHYAFPCFFLAKDLKSPPPVVAHTLSQTLAKFKEEGRFELVLKALPQGPYLNFFLSLKRVGTVAIEKIINGEYFQIPLTREAPKTMIEYSQPNTHKELHVGHMRNLSLGHSLARLHQYCGYPLLTSTFPGDVGTHVAKCLWYLKYHNKAPVPLKEKGAWLGHLYTMAHNRLEDELGTEREDQNRKELSEILAQISKKEGEFYELWKETREWSIDLMKSIYQWANVEFDYWYFESDVDEASLELARKYQREGYFIESQGAIGMDLSEDGLGFCMMIKSDGNGLYATKDLELARRKFEEHKIEKSLYVVDVRQSHHFAQVFKILEKVGFPHAKDCLHLKYDFVELPDGAMSSRKGNIVPIQELIRNMVHHIQEEYLNRYRGQWSEEEILQTANQVALGAIKYGMVRMDNARKIVFDMKEWLKIDGESGPYLQYVYARINSLCEKVLHSSLHPVAWETLVHPLEEAILLKLSQFNTLALLACEQYKPAHLCAYLYDLAKLYNSFYAECPVAKAPTEELSKARLALSKAVSLVLKQGLYLLGIPAPARM